MNLGKEMEAKILNANEQIMKLEYELFLEIREFISKHEKNSRNSI